MTSLNFRYRYLGQKHAHAACITIWYTGLHEPSSTWVESGCLRPTGLVWSCQWSLQPERQQVNTSWKHIFTKINNLRKTCTMYSIWTRSIGFLGVGSGAIYGLNILNNQPGKSSFRLFGNVHAAAGVDDTIGIETNREHVDPLLSDMELRCVQVFFRHGARTPVRMITHIEEVRLSWLYFILGIAVGALQACRMQAAAESSHQQQQQLHHWLIWPNKQTY